ncbi:MAG: SRPBCC family protein [Bacteroidota bacterium]
MLRLKINICGLFITMLLLSCSLPASADISAQLKGNKNEKTKTIKRTTIINASPEKAFAFMDNIENTGMHMTKKNTAMMGSRLTIEWLSENKTGLGTKYRWTGKVAGMNMDFTVEVTKWENGKEKIWETVGEPKLIVLSWYRMFLTLEPDENGNTIALLGIDYRRPKGGVLGFFLAKRYAAWCVNSMLNDTKKHFENND